MDLLKEHLKTLAPLLKQIGFHKKGNSFYLEAGENYGVMNFQQSRDSTKDVAKFTINFGVHSAILGRWQNGDSGSVKPTVDQCHWAARVGSFMPGSPDHWWYAAPTDDVQKLVIDIMAAIQSIVIPEINKRITDAGLMECWLLEQYAGNTEIARFKYLTTLLKEKGDHAVLKQVIEAFIEQSQGKPNAGRATEHLKEIGYSM